MKKFALLTAVGSALLLSACASTGKIAPSYVNPANYQAQSCDHLAEEVRRIGLLANQTKQEKSGLSSTGLGIGITGGRHGIFPTISFGVGTGGSSSDKTTRLAKLYGEHDAMVVAGRKKGCAFAQTTKIYGE